MRSACSFALSTSNTTKVVRAFEAALGKLTRPAAALLFLSGSLAEELPTLAVALGRVAKGVPLLVGVGAGVMNEHLELEGQAAAAGLVWQGGKARAVTLNPRSGDFGAALDEGMLAADASMAFVLLRPDRFEPGVLSTLALGRRQVFGGGTVSTQDVYAVGDQGRVSHGPLAALLCSGPAPLIASTHASRLITALRPITRVSGTMLLEIDGEAALDVLGAAGRDLQGQPLIFVALARPDAGAERWARPSQLSLRPIQGVDPGRRGVMLGEQLPPGLFAGFAVRDAAAARSDMLAMTRDLVRDSAGAAPRFGVYVNCAGRGSTLYSAPNVDSRLLRTRLGDIPIVGFQSAFEFVPQGDRLALSLYAGVLGLFTAPS